MFCYRRGREDGRSSTSSLPPTILTYEAVQEIDLEFTRPVIVLGPLKDRVNDDLMREVRLEFQPPKKCLVLLLSSVMTSRLISGLWGS